MKKWAVLFGALLTVFMVQAQEKGKIGFSLAVDADGFFSPTLLTVTVDSVTAGSAAEKAGIVTGDQILSIDGCDIPGCSASKAKELMKKAPGETLPLAIKHQDGTELVAQVVLQ